MTKERVLELEKYRDFIKFRLSEPVPEKHEANPDTFLAYLRHELEMVESKLQRARN